MLLLSTSGRVKCVIYNNITSHDISTPKLMNSSREKQGMHLPRFESASKTANCEPAAVVLQVLHFLSKFGMFHPGGSHISSNDHHYWRVWVIHNTQNISVLQQVPLLVHPSFLQVRRTGKLLILWGFGCPTPKFWALQGNLSLSRKLNLTFKFHHFIFLLKCSNSSVVLSNLLSADH